MVRAGASSPRVAEWARPLGMTFNRQTYYAHKPHAMTPEERVIQASSIVAQGRPGKLQIQKSSNVEFLEAVRDIGFSKAMDNPEDVSLDQALKAASILEGRKSSGADSVKVLIGIMTGLPPAYTVIDGTAKEVS